MEIVNGYVCQTCCDADLAAKHIDPAHPKDGPFGADKLPDPKDPKQASKARDGHGPAVVLGGRLATDAPPSSDRANATSRVDEASVGPRTPPTQRGAGAGGSLDLTT
jgi:hypothetical protein